VRGVAANNGWSFRPTPKPYGSFAYLADPLPASVELTSATAAAADRIAAAEPDRTAAEALERGVQQRSA
jgi:hypothetical protein